MRKTVWALLVLGLAACGGQGGDEASEPAATPSMTADTTAAQDTMMARDSMPGDTDTTRN